MPVLSLSFRSSASLMPSLHNLPVLTDLQDLGNICSVPDLAADLALCETYSCARSCSGPLPLARFHRSFKQREGRVVDASGAARFSPNSKLQESTSSWRSVGQPLACPPVGSNLQRLPCVTNCSVYLKMVRSNYKQICPGSVSPVVDETGTKTCLGPGASVPSRKLFQETCLRHVKLLDHDVPKGSEGLPG